MVKKKADIPHEVVEVTMKLAAERGWRNISLADIAEEAKLPLSKLHEHFTSKQAILAALSRQADAQVLVGEEADLLEEPAKDRLFDVFMKRFDALMPYREGLAAVMHDQSRDPVAAMAQLCRMSHSMALMLEAAGLSTTGVRGLVRIKAITALYLSVFRVWLKDESEDLTKTMSALDKALGRLDSLARRCGPPRRRSREKEATA